jgi:hypothetical protein
MKLDRQSSVEPAPDTVATSPRPCAGSHPDWRDTIHGHALIWWPVGAAMVTTGYVVRRYLN